MQSKSKKTHNSIRTEEERRGELLLFFLLDHLTHDTGRRTSVLSVNLRNVLIPQKQNKQNKTKQRAQQLKHQYQHQYQHLILEQGIVTYPHQSKRRR